MANLADLVIEDSSDLGGNSERARKALTQDTAGTESSETDGSRSDTVASDPLETQLSGDNVPEKFRGKKLRDVLDSYGNLESRLGTMANELGTQRQLTDRLLDLKRSDDLTRNTPPAQRKPPQVTASEILDKPAETLDRVLNEREQSITAEVNRQLNGIRMSVAEQGFRAKHSDFQTVVNDPAFSEWVRSKPIRLRAAAAANGGDWQIASELLDEYKAEKGVSSSSTSSSTARPSTDLEGARRATLETSTGSGSADGKKKGQRYSRKDLMKLRIEDPESYYDDTFQAKILLAHHEGRVDD